MGGLVRVVNARVHILGHAFCKMLMDDDAVNTRQGYVGSSDWANVIPKSRHIRLGEER